MSTMTAPINEVTGPRRTQKVASLRDPLALTLLSLTLTTGVVDAVSYLGLGHVFTANMTGNVVLLGFGLAGRRICPTQTTVPTMTLTGPAADSPLGGGNGSGTGRRLAASGSLLVGALVGALLTKVNLAAALGVAAASVAITAAAYAGRAGHHLKGGAEVSCLANVDKTRCGMLLTRPRRLIRN